MKNPFAALAVTLVALAILALYLAHGALHRGNVALFVVLLAIAVIFWQRVQRKS